MMKGSNYIEMVDPGNLSVFRETQELVKLGHDSVLRELLLHIYLSQQLRNCFQNDFPVKLSRHIGT